MAVEVVKAEAAPESSPAPATVEQKFGKDEPEPEPELEPKAVEKISSYRQETNFPSDLKDHEKKALNELKKKLEDAINGNTLFKKSPEKKEECSENLPTEGKTEKNNNEPEPDSFSIWGIPLLPSKGDERTDVVLLKFLRAREFKINDSFEMLTKTLQWRKEFKVHTILDEEFGPDLGPVAYMSGTDFRGHPICYNIFGVLEKGEVYEKLLASDEKRERFLRWRVQLMEKGVEKLDFRPGGVNSLVQINDMKNSPGLSRKEVRAVVNKAVALLQDNYPEFVAKNIFINVPFWHFALHSLLSPFLTQRSRSKLVFVRPSKTTETLLKYIPIQEIPIQYGGLKRDEDFEFTIGDEEPKEIVIKAGSTEIVEIPTPKSGTTFIWDLIVLGWEVNYTEEFVPAKENSVNEFSWD
ncbi:Patellin-4 [Striga hermonthica]|uniref:Patellin-4 n=1 Tax=Striga hermonthica TaxID=68872 RepID=A0A9N7NJV9_STRHE|nr:Patellin-4 [Striga hermonthica]